VLSQSPSAVLDVKEAVEVSGAKESGSPEEAIELMEPSGLVWVLLPDPTSAREGWLRSAALVRGMDAVRQRQRRQADLAKERLREGMSVAVTSPLSLLDRSSASKSLSGDQQAMTASVANLAASAASEAAQLRRSGTRSRVGSVDGAALGTAPPSGAGVARWSMGAPEAGVLVQGFLYKRGKLNTSWKKRWVVLRRTGKLEYYRPRDDPLRGGKPRGVILLHDLLDVFACATAIVSMAPNRFDIATSDRQWHFRAESREALVRWVLALRTFKKTHLEVAQQMLKASRGGTAGGEKRAAAHGR